MTAKPTGACHQHVFEPSSTRAPAEVKEAAQQGLQRFLNAIPLNQLRQFNFSKPDELKHATLGMPFRAFVLQPANILHCSVDVPIIELVESLPEVALPSCIRG